MKNLYFAYEESSIQCFGKLNFNNQPEKNKLLEKVKNLNSYGGLCRGSIFDRNILFMTFYNENKPVRTFYSDFPNQNRSDKLKNKQEKNLSSFFKLIYRLIGLKF